MSPQINLNSEAIAQILRDDRYDGDEALRAQARNLALADTFEKGQVDHLRLVRVERMLEFLLSKQVIEVPRRPTEAEFKAFADAKIMAPPKIVESRTWLDEFNAWYELFLASLNKPRLSVAPAPEGDDHAQA